jgi:hypothetical protein
MVIGGDALNSIRRSGDKGSDNGHDYLCQCCSA